MGGLVGQQPKRVPLLQRFVGSHKSLLQKFQALHGHARGLSDDPAMTVVNLNVRVSQVTQEGAAEEPEKELLHLRQEENTDDDSEDSTFELLIKAKDGKAEDLEAAVIALLK